jgi:hypothetical protein
MMKKFFEKYTPDFIQIWFKKKYGFRNVNDIPTIIDSKFIYIVREGTEPETLVFECPCGCGAPVYLNLLKDTTPHWTYEIERKTITIFPSVVRKKGCQSHYWIKKGKIIWV